MRRFGAVARGPPGRLALAAASLLSRSGRGPAVPASRRRGRITVGGCRHSIPVGHGGQRCAAAIRRNKLLTEPGCFFFSNTRAAYHCIKTKKKLVQCSVATQLERTPDGHKRTSKLNTIRKKNSNMNYSHPAQPKRLALSIALSQRSIPWRESSCLCFSTSKICHAMRPYNAVDGTWLYVWVGS